MSYSKHPLLSSCATNSQQESSPSKLSAPSPHTPVSSSQSVQQLKQQLATLTSSMATLMEEKSKMETNFQTDKKTILVCCKLRSLLKLTFSYMTLIITHVCCSVLIWPFISGLKLYELHTYLFPVATTCTLLFYAVSS